MFTIVIDNNGEADSAHISDTTLKQIDTEADGITLHFGSLTKRLKIVIDNSLAPNNIIIPQKVSPEIEIPNLPYENHLKNDHLFLGPVIGYLPVPRYYDNPALLSTRFIYYEKIKGLIFLFRPRNINMINKTISGKYYNPQTKSFVKGVFPYPSVIYNRIPLSRKTFSYLKNNVCSNLFNYPFFNTNKWNFWKWMSKEPSISIHLPQTTRYTGIKSLLAAVNVHKSVYIKPTNLSQGRGILHVLNAGSHYVLSDRTGRKHTLKSPPQLSLLLEKILIKNRNYIIQQAIPFLSSSGNKIDFRVYIQKNYSGEWKYSGMETKVAQKGSIISNSRNREQIVPGEEALASFFGLNDIQISEKVKEITQIGINVLKVLEQNCDHLGDAAIDMVLDKEHKVWLLEVQLNYCADKKAKRSKDERRILPSILPTPFEYAKSLAGF